MRNPGRRDGDDARPDPTDPMLPQSASNGAPADDGAADVRVPDAVGDAPRSDASRLTPLCPAAGPPDGIQPAGASDDLADLDDGLPGGSADFDDDLLFDPLLSDEPIDLAAVRADDALIDALGGSDLTIADDVIDPDDPLIAMLAAWAASSRPEAQPVRSDERIDPSAATAAGDAIPLLRAVADTPDVVPSSRSSAEIVAADPGTQAASASPTSTRSPDTGSAGAEIAATGRRNVDAPDVGRTGDGSDAGTDLPTVLLPAVGRPAAPASPVPRPAASVRPVESRPADEHTPVPDRPAGGRDNGSAGAPRAADTATAAPVVGLFSRVRTLRRGVRSDGRALPSDHPLRRAAVAVVVAALAISGAAASGGTAVPGDPAWAITKVLFAERARSIEAAQVVSEGLERARLALSRRQPDLARQELAAIAVALPNVLDEDGHNQLVNQKQMLEAVAALTPPLPTDPNLTSTTTPSQPADPDTSILAEGARTATDAAKPADPAPAPEAADIDTTTADGATTDSATGTTGTDATGTTGTDATGTTDTGTTGTDATGSTGTDATGTTGTTGTDTAGTGSTDTGTTDTETGATDTGTTDTSTTDTDTGTDTGATDTGTADTSTTDTDTGTTGTDTGTPSTGTDAVGPGTADVGTGDAGDTGTGPALVPAPEPGNGLDTARTGDAGPEPAAPDDDAPQIAAAPEPAAPATDATATESATSTSAAPSATAPPASAPEQPAGTPTDETRTAGAGATAPETPQEVAAGSAPAVPADGGNGPGDTADSVVPEPAQPLRIVETGVVPEPVNTDTTPSPSADATETPDSTRTSRPDPTDTDSTTVERAAGNHRNTDDGDDTTKAAPSDDDSGPGSSGDDSGENNPGDSSESDSDGESDSSDNGSGDRADDDNDGDDGLAGARSSAAVSIDS